MRPAGSSDFSSQNCATVKSCSARMISSIRCDSRAAQAVPPPSSISIVSAVLRPRPSVSLSRLSASARTLSDRPPFDAAAKAASASRSAAPSISLSSLRGILAMLPRRHGGVYSVIFQP